MNGHLSHTNTVSPESQSKITTLGTKRPCDVSTNTLRNLVLYSLKETTYLMWRV